MVSTTHIMVSLLFLCENAYWDSSLLAKILKTACDEVWLNTRSGCGRSSHSLVGIPITRLHDSSSSSTNFLSPNTSGGLFQDYPCFIFLNASVSYLIIYWVEHSLFPRIVISPHNHCRWCGQGSFIFLNTLLLRLDHPRFYHIGWKLVDCQHLGIGIVY